MIRLRIFFRDLWSGLRTLSGDDAYERYLAHWRAHAPHDENAPLSRKSFYQDKQKHEWEKPRRCC